jgi:hypothetical protein
MFAYLRQPGVPRVTIAPMTEEQRASEGPVDIIVVSDFV